MIGYIEGTVVCIQNNEVIINTNGVGYEIQIGTETVKRLNLKLDMSTSLFTHMVVREDSIKIFGFEKEQEKSVFCMLMGVNGIGAKLALTVIDQVGFTPFIKGIQQGNVKLFESISGIGKKSAQKIVIELENKINKFCQLYNISEQTGDSKAPGTSGNELEDLISALINLGYNRNLVEKTVKSLWTENSSFERMFQVVIKKLSEL